MYHSTPSKKENSTGTFEALVPFSSLTFVTCAQEGEWQRGGLEMHV